MRDDLSYLTNKQPTKWILPVVTRAILAEWESEGRPDIWPYPLFDSARGEWVDISSVEELRAATLESEPPAPLPIGDN